MAATGENGPNKVERTDHHRTRYADAKLQSKKDQPAAVVWACERLLKYLHRLGLTRRGDRLLDLGCGTLRNPLNLTPHIS